MEGSQSPEEQSSNGDHDQEQKINVFLKVNKTVCVSAKKSDTVRNVKAILNEKEGLCKSLQSLFFSGEYLNDYRKLVDCGIQENSMVEVFVQDFVPLILFIKPQSHPKIIVIEARPSDTIENVKSAIMAKEGTPLGSFNLIGGGKQLADDRTLESLNVRGGSTLHMLTTRKDEMTLSVKMPYGMILKIEVRLLYSVRDAKTVVESIAGHSVDHLSFIYNGLRLEDSKNLSSYDVTEDSMLEMVPKSVRLFVRPLTGKRWTYDVYPEDLVINLKETLAARLGYAPNHFRLHFDGIALCDHQTLASCNIKNGSTFDIVLTLRGG